MKDVNGVVLDARLAAATSFIRPGGVLCDVGADHAYLSLYALQSGLCSRAIASDINVDPLNRARENGERFGVSDRMKYYLSDGLDGVEPEKNGITDVAICGMGGELIVEILKASEYTRREGVRLILQPMTKAYELRRYLTENGYVVLDEALSRAAGKVYACLCVEFAGTPSSAAAPYTEQRAESDTEAHTTSDTEQYTVPYTDLELLLGRHNIRRGGELFRELVEKEAARLKKRADGLKSGDYDATYEEGLLTELEALRFKSASECGCKGGAR